MTLIYLVEYLTVLLVRINAFMGRVDCGTPVSVSFVLFAFSFVLWRNNPAI